MSEKIRNAWDALKTACREDLDYAWALHCNLAMPIMDATGVSHAVANEAGAHLMSYLFDCDITAHPFYQGKKSDAQGRHEFMLVMDRAEDERIALHGT